MYVIPETVFSENRMHGILFIFIFLIKNCYPSPSHLKDKEAAYILFYFILLLRKDFVPNFKCVARLLFFGSFFTFAVTWNLNHSLCLKKKKRTF